MATQPTVLKTNPGIKRDGTRYEGDFYVDGQWVRFQRNLPRKMGGYRSVVKNLTDTSRGFTNYPQNDLVYCHSGGATKLERFTIDQALNSSVIYDRTPVALSASADNRWMFDYAYNPSGLNTDIFAHVSPNGGSSSNAQGGQIFYAPVLGTTVFTAATLPANANATGGIVMLHPYLFYYGSSGLVGWSVAGTPTDLTGAGSGVARPWGQKILKGLPLRAGSTGGPAGIFWAYDAVLRASFVGGASVFDFDVLATDTSLMSPDSVVDYDGVFYWVGEDRFLTFNGVVRELPNTMNLNWFFDGLNRSQRTKVFAFKVPRYGEIWWCYPRGDATECTHAIVFNVREGSWYDTELPSSQRVSATYSNAFAAPILVSATNLAWVHEQGVDEVNGQTLNPIKSYFETCDMSTAVTGADGRLRMTLLEPDFIQAQDMTVQVTGRANARSPEVAGPVYTFPAEATTPHEQVVALKEQRREMRVRFTSNEVGGDYQMGQVIAHIGTGDKTVLG